ncbi:hypothetical protein DU002_01110 [Corallincola holothuriorum]|uniref:Uncharacterized protein n=1 Tax=Corallincola holothuriorum TaxID=2282215 RepID=A0A368NSZ2_9GAMM|nr:hypothetical protein DU002_01110 [Corallincola holothuriorum]
MNKFKVRKSLTDKHLKRSLFTRVYESLKNIGLSAGDEQTKLDLAPYFLIFTTIFCLKSLDMRKLTQSRLWNEKFKKISCFFIVLRK